MNLIIMGAPGAGKGTQAQIITDKLGIPAISTGDILRGAIKEGTELGRAARSYMDRGELVPDDIVIGMVKQYLSSERCKNGFLLDGFPRSIEQAESLARLGVKIDAVLAIEVDDEKIVERMSGRRVCPGCGASYHLKYNPPKTPGRCDRCSAELYARSDDNPETVRTRLATYHRQTEPVKKYYAGQGLLITVDGNQAIEEISKIILDALSRLGSKNDTDKK
ncbi:MAG: adenylate kinase [Clostridiales bacterium]|nr:adenylate kinase [Clostridiales bacterium]